jgi:Predicted transcriptional regulator with C-terminal CBS domains
MSVHFRDAFQRTLDGLDAGIQVRHIATFNVEYCNPKDTVESVLERKDWRIFSQILVRLGGYAVGVLERKGADNGKTVAERMRPLSEAMLISADAPLSEFLKICHHDSFRLVVDGTSVAGIVTVSDLQKLPVRLHAFTRITHLEMLMAEIIGRRSVGQDDSWRQYLTPRKIKNAEKYRAAYEREDLNLQLIEYTDFGDKVQVISGLCKELALAQPELQSVEKLRHEIMHARPVDESQVGVTTFLERLSLTDKWIDTLHDFTAAEQNEEKTH